MLHNKFWVSIKISDIEVERLSREAGISRLIARVFLSRGVSDAGYIRKFLNPSLSGLHDPFLLKDMGKAVDRIIQAVRSREKIVIYGDYDVDGVTSTSILKMFLSRQGADVDFYIPDRIDEGYGLSISAIDKILQSNPSLIITADCGISAVEEIKYINDKLVDIIVTDHHECKAVLPDAYAVINPCRPDCSYPFKELAGVGVAYKLVNALSIKMNLRDEHNDYLDLVALGTIADVVPLTGENRIIAKHGIPRIESTNNLGLRTLIESSGLKDKPLNSFGVSFVIAPRVNAAGRIGDAGRAVKLFTTDDEKEAFDIAAELNDENRFRQDTEGEIFQQAVDMIESEIDLDKEKVLVVAGEAWHHGVIGIVASRITEKYYRPSILISREGDTGKGSGRSIEGFNLFKALSHCEGFLERFGGHELAAGLTLQIGNLDKFRKMINAYADSILSHDDLMPKIRIDAYINSEDINIENILELEMLAPFGSGNPEPVFGYDGFKINDIRTVGDNKHLKLRLEDNGFYVDAIGFKMGHLCEAFNAGDTLDAAFSLEINSWNSTQKAQINLKDIKPNEEVIIKNNYFYSLDKYIESAKLNDYNIDNEFLKKIESLGRVLSGSMNCFSQEEFNLPQLEEIIPERRDLAAVYQYLKANAKEQMVIDDLFVFAKKVAYSYKICMNYFKVKKSIEIFEELNLLKTEPAGKYGMSIAIINNVKEKTNLENSTLYRKLQTLKSCWQYKILK